MRKSKMEELLNKLIEKGWKPFGFEAKEYKISIFNIRSITLQLYHTKHPTQEWIGYSIRNITSKESWLWQFVCKNELVIDEHYCWDWYIHWDDNWRIEIWQNDYRYRLIESSLCNEEDLEKFLLDNIKVS